MPLPPTGLAHRLSPSSSLVVSLCDPTLTLPWPIVHSLPWKRFVLFFWCWSLGLEHTSLYITNFPNLQDQITFRFLHEAFLSSVEVYIWPYLTHGMLCLCCPLLFRFVSTGLLQASLTEGHVCFLYVFLAFKVHTAP